MIYYPQDHLFFIASIFLKKGLSMDYIYLILAVIGFLIGLIAAMVGIGGGIFFVPTLIFIAHTSIHEAVGTSLLAIFFFAVSSFIAFASKRLVKYRIGLILELTTVPGAYMGALLSRFLPGSIIKVIFASVVLLTSFELIRKTKKEKQNSIKSERRNSVSAFEICLAAILSFFVGVLAGCIGISGGILKTPILILILNLPVANAIATASFMIFVTTLTATIAHYQAGNVILQYGLILGISASIGAQIGARLALKIKAVFIRYMLSLLLMIVAFLMIIY